MSAAGNIIDLYRKHGLAWAAQRGMSGMEIPWLDRFCAPLQNDAHVLDLGCGMGRPMAEYLLHKGYAVTGVDTAQELLNLAQARFPNADFPRAEWMQADMRSLNLRRQFDGILSWHSSFHLDRDAQRALIPLWREHARPGAMLMFTSGPENGEAMGTLGGEPLYHASLAPEEYRALLAANGFTVLEHVTEDPSCGGATIWLAQYCSDA